MEYQNRSQDSIFSNDILSDRPLAFAGFWQRFVAALIDGILLGIIQSVVAMIFGWPTMWSRFNVDESFYMRYYTAYYSTSGIINLVVSWLYSALMESSAKGATLGKMAMGIRVTDESGRQVSFLRATGRHFGKIISSVILFIGYLMMIWDSRKQTLHDKMAGTLVVKSDNY